MNIIMEIDMKDNLLLAKNMDGEKLFMQMEQSMKENEETILKMVWELTRKKRVEYIKESFLIIKKMEKVLVCRLMETGMKECLKMVYQMDKELHTGHFTGLLVIYGISPLIIKNISAYMKIIISI